MSLVIGQSNSSRLKRKFNLDDDSVANAETNNTDANTIYKILILKMFITTDKVKPIGNLDIKQVNKLFSVLTNLDEDDFSSDEEFKTYMEYMKILVGKASNANVVTTIEKDMAQHFKGTNPIVNIFGEKTKTGNSVLDAIDKNKATFADLTKPVYLGQTYEGTNRKGTEGKSRNIMDKIDKNESLFDVDKIKFDETTDNDSTLERVSITWDCERYLTREFLNAGYSISEGDPLELASTKAHLVRIPKKEKGINKPMNKAIAKKTFGLDYEIDITRDSENVITAITFYENGSPKREIKGWKNILRETKKYALSKLDDYLKASDIAATYVLKESNFMVPKPIRDRGKSNREASKPPNVTELVTNYKDLELGVVTIEVKLSKELDTFIDKVYEKSQNESVTPQDFKTTRQDPIPMVDIFIKIDKKGELRLAEAGAFLSTDAGSMKSINEVIKGVKTFVNKTRKFRS